jgi:hypothetical protein
MSSGVEDVINGVFILLLSGVMWKETSNFWAWLALFIPGAFYVIRGLLKELK